MCGSVVFVLLIMKISVNPTNDESLTENSIEISLV